MSATLTPADDSVAPAGPIEASEWFYSRQGVRNGPIPLEEFRRMIEAGELVPEDRVYAEGLGQWAFVHEVKDRLPPKKSAASTSPSASASKAGGPVATAERAAAAKKGATKAGPPKAAAAAAAAPAPAKKPAPKQTAEGPDEGFSLPARGGGVDPESAVGQIGGRAAEILKGFPTPMGDTETSPLDFEQLDELRVATSHRKALLRFKMMCMVLTLGTFCLLFVPMLLIVVGLAKLLPAMPLLTGAPKNLLYTGLGVSVALIVVYQATATAANKARSWGPLALLALLVLGTGVGVWRAMANSEVVFGGLPQKILFGVGSLICLLFIGICIRAIAGAAGFVTSPAWCQEALVYSKL